MKIYLLFCASIYRFYVRKKDRLPEVMTFWLSSTILTANFFTVYDCFRYYFFQSLPFSTVFAFSVFGVIAGINYFIIFSLGSFKEIIPSSKFGISVLIYMIVSLTAVIYIGSLHRARNLQEKQRLQMEQNK